MIVLMCKSNISNLLPKLTGAIYWFPLYYKYDKSFSLNG